MRVATVERAAPGEVMTHATVRGTVWRDALIAWLGQRIVLIALVWLWQSLSLTSTPTLRSIYRTGVVWDARLYGDIARGGYHELWQAAFYPLFPLLERALAPLTGGSAEVAGLVVANAASLGAFALLRLLVARDLGVRVARLTLVYLALFPTSMFLAAAYTEALFLLLAVAAFVALRSERWLLAGLLAALATLTRTTGLVLLLPLALTAYTALRPRWRELDARGRLRACAPMALAALLPLVAFAALQVGLSLAYGVPGASSRAEAQFWGRSLDWPWVGLARSAQLVAAGFPSKAGMDLLFALLWLALAASMLLPRAPRLPVTYVAYTWGALLLALAAPVHTPGESPLVSIARYMLVAFPCFVRLAQWGAVSRVARYVMLAASAGQFIALSWLFAHSRFIA